MLLHCFEMMSGRVTRVPLYNPSTHISSSSSRSYWISELNQTAVFTSTSKCLNRIIPTSILIIVNMDVLCHMYAIKMKCGHRANDPEYLCVVGLALIVNRFTKYFPIPTTSSVVFGYGPSSQPPVLSEELGSLHCSLPACLGAAPPCT